MTGAVLQGSSPSAEWSQASVLIMLGQIQATFRLVVLVMRAACTNLHALAQVPRSPLCERLKHISLGLLIDGSISTVRGFVPPLYPDRVIVADLGAVRLFAITLLRAKRVPIVETDAPCLRPAD